MKTYFRLLSFAKPIEKFAIPYIFYTLLYVLFSSVLYVLLPSLLTALFSNTGNTADAVHAVKNAVAIAQPKWYDFSGWFKFFLNYFIRIHGQLGALQFVCGQSVFFDLIGDLFRYFAGRTMENLRVHTF